MYRYSSFKQVEMDARSGVLRNESELRHAFVEALKEELARSRCNDYLVEAWLKPALDETLKSGRPDIRISNLVIEVESPRAGLDKGREQLMKYMEELYESTNGRVEVYGVVTDGVVAELWKKHSTKHQSQLVLSNSMTNVMEKTIELFCSQKIPIVNVKDLIRLFGV